MSGVGIGIGTPFRRAGKNRFLTNTVFYVVVPGSPGAYESLLTADGQQFLAKK